MNELFKKIRPADVIGVIVVIGGLGLIYLGKDGVVGGLLTAVVAFYFGEKVVQNKINGNGGVGKKNSNSIVTAEDTIRSIAINMGVNADLAVKVAKCESSLNPKATNKNTNGSIDRGIFQWNDKWHPEISDACAFDVECATKAFCKAVLDNKLFWWDPSKKCWDK